MGRDWYWSGRFSKRTGEISGGRGADREVSNSSLGCMSAVLQIFDFQQVHFPVKHPQPSFKPSSLTPQDYVLVPKGAEAPRNSLESDDGIPTVSTSMNYEKNHNLKFPAGMQIKTKLSIKEKDGIINDETSCGSPGTKTPTLVARLMGLDLLPDAQSPSSSSPSTLNSQGKSHPMRPRQHVLTKPRNSTDSDITSCRSVPETPRIYLGRISDVDHRLSLQINKENNVGLREEFELSRLSFSRKKLEDQTHRSPSHYARQIVKQVKESVGRKVGLDITNTVKTREHRRDELLLSNLKSKKSSNRELNESLEDCSPGKQSTSCSPRLKFIETKNKVRSSSSSAETQNSQNVKPLKGSTQPQSIIRVVAMPKSPGLREQQKQGQKKVHQVPQCKKAASEKFRPKLKKPPKTSDGFRNKQEESFVRPLSTSRTNMSDIRNKCKKSNPLSSNIVLNFPTPLPVKTGPSPPATIIIQKQSSASLRDSDIEESNKHGSQLSSCSSQVSKQEATQKSLFNRKRENVDRDSLNGDAFITGAHPCIAESQYVCDILNRTGIQRGTNVSLNNWFSRSHPLDPSIFFHLEECFSSSTASTNAFNNPLSYRCNRKLLFDVVDEVLVDILKSININPWIVSWSITTRSQMQGSKLMEMLLTKIQSFPMSDCQFSEDIDELIEGDLSKLREDEMAFEQEGERLVTEIEGNVLDTLIQDTMKLFMGYTSNLNTWEAQ